MLSVTPCRSSTRFQASCRRIVLALVGLASLASVSLTSLASLVTTDQYIVTETDVVGEDVYVTSVNSTIEGRVDGDLTIFTGDLTITGEVTGSVTVFSSGGVVVAETGIIGGSLKGVGPSARVDGTVAGDLFFVSPSVVISETGTVGRDAMLFAGTARVEGSVGRDVRGRMLRMVVDGTVADDVDVSTRRLEFGPHSTVGGDVLYRSAARALGVDDAEIGGTLTRLPAQSNFVYGVILALANIIGFFGFVVAGIVVLWLGGRASAKAIESVWARPVATFGVGLVALVALPTLVIVLAMTLVGIPLAILLVLVAIALVVVGPIPAVTAFGQRMLGGRGGLFAGFVCGATVWRLAIWLIPVVGGLLWVLALVWGIGGWVRGVRRSRQATSSGADRSGQGS